MKTLLAWAFLILALLLVIRGISRIKPAEEIFYSDFKRLLNEGRIVEVMIRNDWTLIRGIYVKEKKLIPFKTVPIPDDPELVKMLSEKNVKYSGEVRKGWGEMIFYNFGPAVLFIIFWYLLFFRSLAAGGKQAFSFGKSKAKLYEGKKSNLTFKDVAGYEEVKEELREVIDFLKNPQKYKKMGAKIPKGILLYGAPGTGKTLLAKAVAGEAGVAFFSSSGSEFVEMFVGVGASRVRDLFEQGRKHAPCLLFIDELDAVGRYRFSGIGGGHDEREQTLNQLLVELDGFDSREGVILLAATNRPDVLDAALLRPGRFDRHIYVPPPNLIEREEILKVHCREMKLASDVDLKTIARRTPGFVGADLANIVNEAALLSARKNLEFVDKSCFDEAIEKVMAGPQKKSRTISEKEKKIIAYHEAGHVLVAKSLPGSEPVHKVSIIPRGPSLGYTLQLPLEEKYLITKQDIITKITILLGGRESELIEFNEVTTGAQNDLMHATELARKMVCEYGMSDRIGPLTLRKKEAEVFFGRDFILHDRLYSDKTAEIIDEEIRALIEKCQSRASLILKERKADLDKLAQAVMEREILEEDDIKSILGEN